VAVERVVFYGEQAGLVRPVLEELALGEHLIETALRVVAEPAPEYEVGATGYDVDSVYLEGTHAADGAEHVWFGSLLFGAAMKSLSSEHGGAGLSLSQLHRREFINGRA
jgi:hypothetical protein